MPRSVPAPARGGFTYGARRAAGDARGADPEPGERPKTPSGLNSEAMGRANLDGTGVNQSFISGLNGPQGVAVNSTHVFWSSFETTSIGRASLNGTSPNPGFITGLGSPGALASAAG